MTVGELIAKLAKLPPSTVVVTDDNESFDFDEAFAYTFQGQIERHKHWMYVRRDNGRDDVETVLLISAFGHDDMEEL
ncbi:hypothetical protein [Prescottella agglutinans]|uniref:Uncharacterized protein n=1 Tax=Prescottella agglutinans TaxID=1644129 RepID=A0ABT6MEU8_9NOCA|nr:hypothetical protein [Prescottella agglutinans]MDH6282840.1 hypothetical protein [Prescottella agglutinans]